ncbi:MAG TPA: 2Fe-2S iron-sulfur cluster-binding protein, partial [Acidobacteriota bacterium]|nr:2Fe-2S iron-sulfur cluster-binding protein [Acidobacteriota bacterium]
MNGLEVSAEEGWTILETAKFYGLEIPTLCYYEGLTPYGGCRMCVVEIGEGERAKLVSSCTYPVEQGMIVRTDTRRVVAARKMMIELMVSVAPGSKVLQDLASQFGVTRIRFEPRHEECILCGRCVRICA